MVRLLPERLTTLAIITRMGSIMSLARKNYIDPLPIWYVTLFSIEGHIHFSLVCGVLISAERIE